MQLIALYILLLVTLQRKSSVESVDAFGVTLLFERPDKVTWHTFQRLHDDSLGVGTISFRSLPVVDRKGRAYEPVVAIIYEKLADSVSVLNFAETKQTSSRTKWTVLRTYGPDARGYQNATFYDGEYEAAGEQHAIIVGYMVYGTLGVQVIGDCPESIFSEVEDDVRRCVQSVRFGEGK